MDNIESPLVVGTKFATDLVDSVHYPRTKISHGIDGTAKDVSIEDPFPVTGGRLTAGINRSGTIQTANASQVLAPANVNRIALYIQNISDDDIWITELLTGATIAQPGNYCVSSLDAFTVSTNRAVHIVGATAGQAFSATEV